MKKIISLFATFFIMGMIFFLSAQPGAQSYDLSAAVADKIQNSAAAAITPSVFSANLNANIRKWAHIYIYCALGASMAATVYLHRSRKSKSKVHHYLFCAGVAAILCLAYAATDELHQFFVPGRAALLSDIAIDAVGFLPCIAAACLIFFCLDKEK